MRAFIIVCGFLCSVSCGPPDGLVINKNGFVISNELLWNTIYIAEQHFNEFYEDKILDANSLIEQRGVSIEFLQASERNQEEVDRGLYGYYYERDHAIELFINPEPRGKDSQNWRFIFDDCYWKYFPLAHEFLHFVTYEHLQWEGKPHMYPGMYYQWAEKNKISSSETVEGSCSVSIIRMCMAEVNR